MKTIKQIADELGVSKTTIRKIINDLKMQTSLRLNGNQFAINEQQESLIKSHFFNISQTKSKSKVQTETETDSELVSVLKEQILNLKEQNNNKDKQIQSLLEKLDQEQKLHLATIQDKQQLQIELKEEKENKSIFSKIFRKK